MRNGVILSRDEKTLYVTNGATLAAFDVQRDGSLTNQREFAKFTAGGGDGDAIDSEGRLYVTTGVGVEVIGRDGKHLGVIPTPRGVISCALGGKDKKTLFVLARGRRTPRATKWPTRRRSIPMIAQGYTRRAK
jgi:gluconolactonase